MPHQKTKHQPTFRLGLSKCCPVYNTPTMRLTACVILLSAGLSASGRNCDQLASAPLGADVKIESAKLVAASGNLPEHCDVRGTIWPEARFALKMPTAWNNRFEMAGNGGWAGTISLPAVDSAMRQGYAAVSTDTGHDARKEPDASFAYASPANPHAARKLVDYGYLAVHETARLSKEIIREFYGTPARYSYWVGCSTGGRQGLMEAQRYPEDFDGYVIGAPVLYLTGLQMKSVWNYQVAGTGAGAIKAEKLPLLSQIVYKKCDSLDGLEDGLIENPLLCELDPETDLPPCTEDADGAGCFTKAQRSALKMIYDGPKDSHGRQFFPGMPPGGDGSVSGGFRLGESFMKFVAFDPPAGPSWDYRTFNLDTDPARTARAALIVDAVIPDLTAVKMRGGKIVHYHGWADPGVSPKMSLEYFEAVSKIVGEAETRDFYRFFPVPGMFHCGGGPGCSDVDWLPAAVAWVEKGIAPEVLIGKHVDKGETTRTRPICAYPAMAKYKGSGSIDAAESFSCAPASR